MLRNGRLGGRLFPGVPWVGWDSIHQLLPDLFNEFERADNPDDLVIPDDEVTPNARHGLGQGINEIWGKPLQTQRPVDEECDLHPAFEMRK